MLGLLWLGAAHASFPLNDAWREVRAGDTPQSGLDEYNAGQLKSFDPSMLQRFPRSASGSWAVITPQPPWDHGARILTIYPPALAQSASMRRVWRRRWRLMISALRCTDMAGSHGRFRRPSPAPRRSC
ncbi:MAG TPA: hypothetical protein VGC19_15550 [Rhodanobacter sp.]